MNKFFRLLTIFSFAAIAQQHIEAQLVTGSIVGTVVDSSNATVPGAQITLTNLGTRAMRTMTTGTGGNYVFSELTPGNYSIVTTSPGFKKTEITALNLQVAQTVRADIRLEVGSTTEEVTVTAPVVLLDTETSSVGQVVDRQYVEALPLNGRNFMQLALLGAGVVPAYQGRSSPGATGTGRGSMVVHISGGRGDANSYLIDGVETRTVQLGPPSVLLSPDAIQEFKIQRNGFEARYGQGSGIVSIVTRSGSNEFHGSAYEFLRNNRLDAANFFDNYFSNPQPAYRQNQFGASAGGPIRKDRLFFFGNYEGLRVRRGSTANALVPTQEQLSGNLAGLPSTKRDATGAPAILNPFTGEPFPGSVIPASLLSPIIQKFKKYIPAPNAGLRGVNLVATPVTAQDENQFTTKIDSNIGQRDTLSGRYTWYKSELFRPGYAQYYGTTIPYRGQSASIQETHTFSPRFVNVLTAGYNRGINLTSWENTPFNAVEELGLKNLNPRPIEYGLPTIVAAGFSNMGPSIFIGGGIGNIYQIADVANFTAGAHQISFGTDIRQTRFQFIAGASNNGLFTFDGRYSGNALADMLLGTAATAQGQGNPSITNWRSNSYSFFIQDNVKIGQRLTLNLGLRYEYERPFYETRNREGYFDTSTQQVVVRLPRELSQVQLPESKVRYAPELREGLWQGGRNRWAPRIGFAYRLTDRTVLRSAYGIFYSLTQGNELQGKANMPPLVFSTSLAGSLTTPNVLIDRDAFPSPSQLQFGTLAPFTIDPSDTFPYLQQWNFGVEHRLSSSMMVEASYVASRGTHLGDRININQAVPPENPAQPTPIAQRRPYPEWGDILSYNFAETSSYHSLQLRAEKRFSGGLSFLAGYTWSHSIDTSSRGAGAASFHQDRRNLKADRGSSDFDVRHNLVVSYSYELPLGKGRRFLSGISPAMDKLIGGWSVNGISTFMTGFYLTPVVTGDRANTGGFPFQRANVNAGCSGYGNLPRGERTIDRYLDTACFSVTPFGTFGNSGRNVVISPGLNNWDLSIFKNIPLNENLRLQFRSEMFNVWNHTQLGPQQMNVQNPLFGSIRSARDPRQIQFALKLLW